MPSSNRRRFLAAIGAAGTTALAGCSVLGRGRPDVNPASGLSEDTSQTLEHETVYLADDASDLPDPPKTTDSVAEADVVLARAGAATAEFAGSLRDGKVVAFARGGAEAALGDYLTTEAEDYTYGLETVRARPVELAVATPGWNGSVSTFTFVQEGGWEDPVLDPLGWALTGRVPECDTFVPESSMDDQFEYAGATHVAGRLSTGETYVSRSEASVARQDAGTFVRLRTKLHAAANDGYAIEEGVREADLPDDQHLHEVYPNPHTQNGVEVANASDTTRSTFAIQVTPDSPRARATLTGCGGLETEDRLAYDHRTSFQWKRDELLGAKRHYASATGRGEWHLDA